MGEEVFRGVAICCFCCPVVKTGVFYSQAPSFELEQSDFCVCMYETETDTERETHRERQRERDRERKKEKEREAHTQKNHRISFG